MWSNDIKFEKPYLSAESFAKQWKLETKDEEKFKHCLEIREIGKCQGGLNMILLTPRLENEQIVRNWH